MVGDRYREIDPQGYIEYKAVPPSQLRYNTTEDFEELRTAYHSLYNAFQQLKMILMTETTIKELWEEYGRLKAVLVKAGITIGSAELVRSANPYIKITHEEHGTIFALDLKVERRRE